MIFYMLVNLVILGINFEFITATAPIYHDEKATQIIMISVMVLGSMIFIVHDHDLPVPQVYQTGHQFTI